MSGKERGNWENAFVLVIAGCHLKGKVTSVWVSKREHVGCGEGEYVHKNAKKHRTGRGRGWCRRSGCHSQEATRLTAQRDLGRGLSWFLSQGAGEGVGTRTARFSLSHGHCEHLGMENSRRSLLVLRDL